MTLQADLLEQAQHLSRRESKRPKQASLRRAVSAAYYYSVFHLIVSEAVAVIGADLTLQRRAQVQRWFEHGEMKKICQRFLANPFVKPPSLTGFKPSTHLQTVARNFVLLQEARHKADYDVYSAWTRWNCQQQVQLASEATSAWTAIRGTEEANLFVLALLLWKHFEAEH